MLGKLSKYPQWASLCKLPSVVPESPWVHPLQTICLQSSASLEDWCWAGTRSGEGIQKLLLLKQLSPSPYFYHLVKLHYGFPGGSKAKSQPAVQETQETQVWFLGWENRGQGNPLQYSCLENPIDRGAWKAAVHRVTKSQTWLKRRHTHTHAKLHHLDLQKSLVLPVLGLLKILWYKSGCLSAFLTTVNDLDFLICQVLYPLPIHSAASKILSLFSPFPFWLCPCAFMPL